MGEGADVTWKVSGSTSFFLSSSSSLLCVPFAFLSCCGVEPVEAVTVLIRAPKLLIRKWRIRRRRRRPLRLARSTLAVFCLSKKKRRAPTNATGCRPHLSSSPLRRFSRRPFFLDCFCLSPSSGRTNVLSNNARPFRPCEMLEPVSQDFPSQVFDLDAGWDRFSFLLRRVLLLLLLLLLCARGT